MRRRPTSSTWALTWASLCACLLAGCALSPTLAPTRLQSESDFQRYVVVTLRNAAAPSVPRAGSTVRGYEPPPAYAVAPTTRDTAKIVGTAHGLREVTAWPIGLLGVHCIVYEIPRGADRDEIIAQLRRDGRVESAQAFNAFSTLTTKVNDPYRRLQQNLDLMDVAGAHNWSRGEGVRVAIIDTGVDARHPDLVGRIVRQKDFVHDGKGVAARERHGTAVAGVIAAVDNNRQGIIGIAPAARLYALRACWPGAQDDGRAFCSTLSLAEAISAAIDANAEIVNLSLTGPADPLLTRLVNVGLQRGIVFVGASPMHNDAPAFPTDIDGVIRVDTSGSHNSADSVLFAPGNEVLTLVPDGRYDFLSGSSLAAASVSGGIALLLARDRNLRAADAREILERTSRTVSTERGALSSINLCAALALLPNAPACAD